MELAEERKKTLEHESDGDTNLNWFFQYIHQRISIIRVWQILGLVLDTWRDLQLHKFQGETIG